MTIDKIDCSLSLGSILNGIKKRVFWFAFVVALLMNVFFVGFFITSFFIVEIENDFRLMLSISCIMAITFSSFLIYIKYKDDCKKKIINEWLKDGLLLYAHSKEVDFLYAGFQPRATKILVSFKYCGFKIKKESTAKVFGGKTGYLGTFNKYVNKSIKILYSPKYDEVLILK